MQVGERCTVCGDRIATGQSTKCETCGRRLHTRCSDYHEQFECETSEADREIGAVEF